MLKIRSASVYGATLPDSLDAITDGLNTLITICEGATRAVASV